MSGETQSGKLTVGQNSEGFTTVFIPPVGLNRLMDVTVDGFVQNGPVIRSSEGGIRAVRYYTETVELDSEGTSAELFLKKQKEVAEKIGYTLDPAEIVDLDEIARARLRRKLVL